MKDLYYVIHGFVANIFKEREGKKNRTTKKKKNSIFSILA
jgi:hypothetical protein